MKGLPQDDLLSAYLDDELSPTERAEVEKLLAADPAARQSLEQLRDLSAEVRSLPRQKLGEDLSKQVLELAQQRRLQTSPEADSLQPSQPIFRRFLSRRNLVWLSLTAAIAILISINERSNLFEPARPRKVAVAPAKQRQEGLQRPLPPSSIQAAPEATSGQPDRAADAASAPSSPAPAERPHAAFARKSQAPKADVPSAASPASSSSPAVARQEGFGGNSPSPTAFEAFQAARPMAKDKAPANSDQAIATSSAAQPALVVHCQITPAAAKSNALQNLLAANGIAWRLQAVPAEGAPEKAAEKFQERSDTADQQAAKYTQDTKDVFAAPPAEFHAQATGEQLQNVLATLATQPEYFVSVALQPPHQRKAQVVFDQRNRNLNQRLVGGAASSQRQPANAANQRQVAAPPPTVLNRTTGAQSDREANVRPQAEDAAPTQVPTQQSQAAAHARRQTVLFVIRVVDLSNAAPAPEAK